MAQMSDHPHIRVLVCDDETLMRAGLRLMIDGTHGIEVVAEASDGDEALTKAAEHDPDVILMDVRMPRMSGLDATRRLVDSGTRARIVVLTAFDTDDYLLHALRAGAVSFLLKDSPPESVVDAVLSAACGEPRFSSASLRRLVRMASVAAAPPAATPRRVEPGQVSSAETTNQQVPETAPEGITDGEWDVALLVAQGLTNHKIAERLYLSVPTIKTHLGRLFDKLGVTNRVQLALKVIEGPNTTA